VRRRAIWRTVAKIHDNLKKERMTMVTKTSVRWKGQDLAFKGPKTGVQNLIATAWKVKPGHAKALREAMARVNEINNPEGGRIDTVFIPTGVHYAILSIWDNDQQFWFCVSFDTEFDPYLEDIFRLSNRGSFHFDVFQHLEGGPADMGVTHETWTVNEFKAMLLTHEVETLAFLITVPDITTAETVKAQRLLKAFQQVLDNPNAAEALHHPALKPLLDLAAE
jgi:hypothetical protein